MEDLNKSEKQLKEVENFIKNFGISEFERQVIFLKGRIQELKNNYTNALEIYQEYLNQEPSSIDVLIRMGICYKYLQKYNKAINMLERALKIMPISAESMAELALVYKEAGNTEKTANYLKQALNIW